MVCTPKELTAFRMVTGEFAVVFGCGLEVKWVLEDLRVWRFLVSIELCFSPLEDEMYAGVRFAGFRNKAESLALFLVVSICWGTFRTPNGLLVEFLRNGSVVNLVEVFLALVIWLRLPPCLIFLVPAGPFPELMHDREFTEDLIEAVPDDIPLLKKPTFCLAHPSSTLLFIFSYQIFFVSNDFDYFLVLVFVVHLTPSFSQVLYCSQLLPSFEKKRKYE